jgi:CheY-like chemotaxis protein
LLTGGAGAIDEPSPESQLAPLEANSEQSYLLRAKAKKMQDGFRVRLVIPKTTLETKAPATVEERVLRAQALQQPSPVSETSPGQNMILGALLCFLGLLILHKLAPEWTGMIFERAMPWRSSSRDEIEDDQAFSEFLVKFKAAPAVTPASPAANNNKSDTDTHNKPSGPDPERLRLLQPFFAWAPRQILEMRASLQKVQHQDKEAIPQSLLAELVTKLRTLKEMAEFPELLPAWQVASTTEGLVGQLAERPDNMCRQRIRTVANGLDLLSELCQPGLDPSLSSDPPIRILAVDDDLISRSAVGLALRRVFNQPDLAANAPAAMAQASAIHYDVIFLDILMPGTDGFELCSSIRETELNQTTPVVFVTSQNDFETRAKSHLCGGNDFMTKPFLTFEITLKALAFTLRGRLEQRKTVSKPQATREASPSTCPA